MHRTLSAATAVLAGVVGCVAPGTGRRDAAPTSGGDDDREPVRIPPDGPARLAMDAALTPAEPPDAGGTAAPPGADAASLPDARMSAGVGASPGDGAAPDRNDGAAASSTCSPTADYAFCSGFEGSPSDTKFKLSTGETIETGNAAHGQYALHLTNFKPHSGRMFGAPLTGIKDLFWGRFYMYLKAGPPQGHTALLYVGDTAGAGWEMGIIFNHFMSVYHYPGDGGETGTSSSAKIPGERWLCVEFLFDGATPAVPKIWVDGAVIPWTSAIPKVGAARQFKSLQIGINFVGGTSLSAYDGTTAPNLTDLWLDDVALGTKRIGCLK